MRVLAPLAIATSVISLSAGLLMPSGFQPSLSFREMTDQAQKDSFSLNVKQTCDEINNPSGCEDS